MSAIAPWLGSREPSERTTVIKNDHDDGTQSKTVIHDRD